MRSRDVLAWLALMCSGACLPDPLLPNVDEPLPPVGFDNDAGAGDGGVVDAGNDGGFEPAVPFACLQPTDLVPFECPPDADVCDELDDVADPRADVLAIWSSKTEEEVALRVRFSTWPLTPPEATAISQAIQFAFNDDDATNGVSGGWCGPPPGAGVSRYYDAGFDVFYGGMRFLNEHVEMDADYCALVTIDRAVPEITIRIPLALFAREPLTHALVSNYAGSMTSGMGMDCLPTDANAPGHPFAARELIPAMDPVSICENWCPE